MFCLQGPHPFQPAIYYIFFKIALQLPLNCQNYDEMGLFMGEFQDFHFSRKTRQKELITEIQYHTLKSTNVGCG